MSRWVVACALAVAMSTAAAAQGVMPKNVPAAPKPRPVDPPKPSGIVGHVVDSRSGLGVPKALVRLVTLGGSVVQTRLADDRGRFYFKGIKPGDFTVDVERNGYFASSFGQRRANGLGTPITVGENAIVGNLRVEMFRPSVIAGSVLDEAGEPLVGVSVRALRREYVNGAWRFEDVSAGETDDRGDYRLVDLIPGEYVVAVPAVKVTIPNDTAEAANASGTASSGLTALLSTYLSTPQNGLGAGLSSAVLFDHDERNRLLTGRMPTPPPRSAGKVVAYPNSYYAGVDLLKMAMPIAIAPGETRNAVVFQLRPVPTSRLSGRVLGSGRAIANRPLRLLVDGDDDLGLGTEVAATVSAPDGSFTFLDVPSGRYVVEARGAWTLPSAGDAVDTLVVTGDTDSDMTGWGFAEVTLFDDDLNNVAVSLSPPLAVLGRVIFDSSSGSTLAPGSVSFTLAAAFGPAIAALPTASLNAGGTFVLTGLPAGRFGFRVNGIPYGWTVKSVFIAGVDVADGWFDLRAGPPVEAVVTLTDRITRTIGTVRDIRGVSQTSALVVAFPAERRGVIGLGVSPLRMRAARVTASGVYYLDGLPPGDYIFVAIDDAIADGWQDEARLVKLAPLGTRVTLKAGDNRTIDLRPSTVRR